MKAKILTSMLVMNLLVGVALAQNQTQSMQVQPTTSGGHTPPPQAYEDCKGKKAGEAVQHTTREGKVAAVCAESPQGLVARPNRTQGTTAAPLGK